MLEAEYSCRKPKIWLQVNMRRLSKLKSRETPNFLLSSVNLNEAPIVDYLQIVKVCVRINLMLKICGFEWKVC